MQLKAGELYCSKCGGIINPPKIACVTCFASYPVPRQQCAPPKPDDPSGLLADVPEIEGLDKLKNAPTRLPGGQYGA